MLWIVTAFSYISLAIIDLIVHMLGYDMHAALALIWGLVTIIVGKLVSCGKPFNIPALVIAILGIFLFGRGFLDCVEEAVLRGPMPLIVRVLCFQANSLFGLLFLGAVLKMWHDF